MKYRVNCLHFLHELGNLSYFLCAKVGRIKTLEKHKLILSITDVPSEINLYIALL